jgi:hypothetical protein
MIIPEVELVRASVHQQAGFFGALLKALKFGSFTPPEAHRLLVRLMLG